MVQSPPSTTIPRAKSVGAAEPKSKGCEVSVLYLTALVDVIVQAPPLCASPWSVDRLSI